jgi:hypothetical protein
VRFVQLPAQIIEKGLGDLRNRLHGRYVHRRK